MKTLDLPLSKKTARLILRPLELMDYPNWAQAYSCMNPPQNEWDETNWDESELTLKKFKEFLKEEQRLHRQDHTYSFGVFLKSDGTFIGQVRLMDISRGVFQNAYIGYRIFNNYWGHGFAQESTRGALNIAFKKLKLHRVEAGIAPTNKKSIRVAKALGFRKEGLSKRRLLVHKKWQDMEIYAMTKEEFR